MSALVDFLVFLVQFVIAVAEAWMAIRFVRRREDWMAAVWFTAALFVICSAVSHR